MILALSGVTLFAFQPADVRTRWLSEIEPKPAQTEVRKFIAAADAAKKAGHGRAASSFARGITDISAPIIRGDRAAAAITVPYIKTNRVRSSVPTVIEKLKVAADQIGGQLAEGDNRA